MLGDVKRPVALATWLTFRSAPITMNRDIDIIINAVKQRIPNARISQHQVSHPGADDVGLWFFSLPASTGEIQIESTSGNCPFLIEHSEMQDSNEAVTASRVEEAVETVASYLAALRSEPPLRFRKESA